MVILKVVIIIVGILFAYYLAYSFGVFYNSLFPKAIGAGWIGSSDSIYSLVGLPLSSIFFLTMVFRGILQKFKFLIFIIILPFFIWEFYIDLSHVYVPIILGVLGWSLGMVINKLISRKIKGH